MDELLEELIDRCFRQPDDPEALTNLDRVLRPLICVALMRLARGPALVEDAYHSAFIQYIHLFRRGRRPDIENYANYFLALAKNLLIDEIRQRDRTDRLMQMLADDAGASSPVPDSLDRIIVMNALTRLEPRCQFVLESYYFAGQPAGDLAQELGIDGASVYMILKRCRARLRKILEARQWGISG